MATLEYAPPADETRPVWPLVRAGMASAAAVVLCLAWSWGFAWRAAANEGTSALLRTGRAGSYHLWIIDVPSVFATSAVAVAAGVGVAAMVRRRCTLGWIVLGLVVHGGIWYAWGYAMGILDFGYFD